MNDTKDQYVTRCACGARIRFGDKHAGRTVRCRKCSSAVVLLPATHPPDDAYEIEPHDDSTRRHARLPHAPARYGVVPMARHRAQELAHRRRNDFHHDVHVTLFFPQQIQNLLPWLGSTVIVALAVFGAFLHHDITIPTVFFGALASAYWLRVARAVAGGDDDLPPVWGNNGGHGWFVSPFIEFFGSLGMTLSPGLLLAVHFTRQGVETIDAFTLASPLLLIGAALWPAALIMSATLGCTALIRYDIMLRTAIAAPLAYTIICGLICAGIALSAFLAYNLGLLEKVSPVISSGGDIAVVLAKWAATSVILSYLAIVAMRACGLYYRHYSDRFPWSAG